MDKAKTQTDLFYGTVTVGERGQIVIPAEARRELEIKTGDRLIVMGAPNKHHLMICKLDSIKEFLAMITDYLGRAEEAISDDPLASEETTRNGGPRP